MSLSDSGLRAQTRIHPGSRHCDTAGVVDETIEVVPSDEYRDYFAELYVAGLVADAGWNVYFPHRDRGLDFIASKTGGDGQQIIRPVQVKGKYPCKGKTDKQYYG